MADPKRKLPVIYALLDKGDVCWGAEVHRENAEKRKSIGLGVAGSPVILYIVEYEPAVPRCKTCRKFTKDWDEDSSDRSWYYCPELESDEPFPQDGSGYCHMHTGLKLP